MDISTFKTAITDKLGTDPASPPPPEKRPRLPLFVVAIVVVAGLSGGAYFFLAGGGGPTPDSEMDMSTLANKDGTPVAASPVNPATEPSGFNNAAAINAHLEPTVVATAAATKPDVEDKLAGIKSKFENRREKIAKARKQQLQALYKRYPQRRGPEFTKKRDQINKKFQADLKKLDQEEKLALNPGAKPNNTVKAKPQNRIKLKTKKATRAVTKNSKNKRRQTNP